MNYGEKTLEHFGFGDRLNKLVEEMAELLVEITHYQKSNDPDIKDDHFANMLEEVADVKNVLSAIEVAFESIYPGKLAKVQEFKQNRTLEVEMCCGYLLQTDFLRTAKL